MTITNLPAASAGSYQVGDMELNRIGYGAMQLSGPGVFGSPRGRAVAIEVLRTAVELSVNHIDTADAYGPYYNIANQADEALLAVTAGQHIAYVPYFPLGGRRVLAATSLTESDADPGQFVGRTPAREHRRRGSGPALRRGSQAGRDLSSGGRSEI
jgi:aryl-alcohol dehydrogenase-like predicted oxidoreductase